MNSLISTIDSVKNHGKFATDNLSTNLSAESGELGWWIEVFTAQPPCVYYFGAYETEKTAEAETPGFIEDLADEGIQGLVTRIQFCHPKKLTIDPEEMQFYGTPHFASGVDMTTTNYKSDGGFSSLRTAERLRHFSRVKQFFQNKITALLP